MKKFILVLTVVIISFVLLNADTGKYTDVKELLTIQAKVFEEYIKGCESAKDAKDVAVVINKMTDGFKSMIPHIKALAKKYGNLEEVFDKNPPEELKPDIEKMEELSKKMVGASMKLGQYIQDPEVKKANEEFQKVMKEMEQIVKPKTEAPGEKKDDNKEE